MKTNRLSFSSYGLGFQMCFCNKLLVVGIMSEIFAIHHSGLVFFRIRKIFLISTPTNYEIEYQYLFCVADISVRGWEAHMKGAGMLVVSLRGIDFGFLVSL